MRSLIVALLSALCLAGMPAVALAADGSDGSTDAPLEQPQTIPPDAGEPTDVVPLEPTDGTTTDGTQTNPDGTPVPPDESAPTETAGDANANGTPDWADPGFGTTATLDAKAKRAEARDDCQPGRDPVSRMLAVGNVTGGSGTGPWVLLAGIIGGIALLIAVGAWLRRHRRTAAGTPKAPRGPLETVATIVAIFGGITGLAVQFVPGLGVDKSAGPAVTMEVRDVDARIRHSEFERKIGVERSKLSKIDKREVGNVVWLEIQMNGLEDHEPVLQYALHDPGKGGALLRGTEKEADLDAVTHKEEHRFAPVWVGYPKTKRFEAHFRLVEDGKVLQIASTGRMKASKFRYDCDKFVKALGGT
jgi:hypothetical protein